ncbi:MAG: dTMP kinase [Candidatus Micrarchaeota archaeon]|nr:dTMP kinase [Candidatus Micrarchaeota archaeon]
MLIVFEGIDGSGKGIQVGMLSRFFRQSRIGHKVHKYPTRKAKEALQHLYGEKEVPACRLAEIFAQDMLKEQSKIMQEIRQGLVVVCDRYFHSTLAYQGASAGYGKVKKMLLESRAVVPELVLVMDIAAKEGAARKRSQKSPDRHERDVAFLEKVRKNYLRMAREGFLSYKYAVIDASKPKDEVFSHVLAQVEPIVARKAEGWD